MSYTAPPPPPKMDIEIKSLGDINYLAEEIVRRFEDIDVTAIGDSEPKFIPGLASAKKVKCEHCGQWGEKYTECDYCGAPIE